MTHEAWGRKGYAHFWYDQKGVRSTAPSKGVALEILSFGVFGPMDGKTEQDIIPNDIVIFYRTHDPVTSEYDWARFGSDERVSHRPVAEALAELQSQGFVDVYDAYPRTLFARRIARRIDPTT